MIDEAEFFKKPTDPAHSDWALSASKVFNSKYSIVKTLKIEYSY